MRKSNGPKSGLEEDFQKARKSKLRPVVNPRIKRVGKAIELYDESGLRAVMRAEDFDKMQEDFKK